MAPHDRITPVTAWTRPPKGTAGVLISYDRLPDGTWEARLLWSRGDQLTATGPTLADARTKIRAALTTAVGETEAASILEWSAESLPLGADD